MSETRNLQPHGGQANEEEVALNPDTEFRTSKSSLSKSKEKVSADGAEEKLLSKQDEAKIVTRVDMADAKYTHTNGDTKIELDANKRQFSGLTKEELMKYADDPFWVNLRWFMFVLFWAMWLCMLAGAIAIIVRAPKCEPPTPRTWYERGPLVDFKRMSYPEVEAELPLLKSSKVQGIFVEVPTYDILDKPSAADEFKALVAKAKEYGVKIIVDLIPNFVSITHDWFKLSENRTAPYTDYFVWASEKEFDDAGKPKPPNNWVSTLNAAAWTYNDQRKQFYLHQYAEDEADLNFHNEEVVNNFHTVLDKWIQAGADGVRLVHARLMLVNTTQGDEMPAVGWGAGGARGADHSQYTYWRHAHSADLPQLDRLLADMQARLPADTVFTMKEEGLLTELYLLERNVTSLRPPSAAPVYVRDVTAVGTLTDRLHGHWPALQLLCEPEAERELALFALLLPAAPVFSVTQLQVETNETITSETLSHLTSLRWDASVEHGATALAAVSAAHAPRDTRADLLAVARWKSGHTGYLAVFNPSDEQLRANLTSITSVPESLTLHHASHAVKLQTNYENNVAVKADDTLVPAKSTLVLSYVPKTSAEN